MPNLIDPNTIDWNNAPPVPLKVLEKKVAGKDIGGVIVDGPHGLKTFVRHGADRPSKRAVSPMVVHASASTPGS